VSQTRIGGKGSKKKKRSTKSRDGPLKINRKQGGFPSVKKNGRVYTHTESLGMKRKEERDSSPTNLGGAVQNVGNSLLAQTHYTFPMNEKYCVGKTSHEGDLEKEALISLSKS